jgi:acetyl-CoA carboxylase beta subunit
VRGDELDEIAGVRRAHRQQPTVAPHLERAKHPDGECLAALSEIGDVVVAVDDALDGLAGRRIEQRGQVGHAPVAGPAKGEAVRLVGLVDATDAGQRQSLHQ